MMAPARRRGARPVSCASVAVDRRLTRLRAVIAHLERLPDSPRREWMLEEARARMVDVETGEATRPMRPLPDESAPAEVERPPAKPARIPRAQVEPSAEPVPEDPPPSPPARLGPDEVLSLGDAPEEPVPPPPGDDPDGWRRGLRG
jgi:hypothetical protein